MEQNKDKLNSIEKALVTLLAFQENQQTWGVRELGTHLDLNPATVQRILQTLKSFRFIDQDPKTRQYRLGNIFYRFLNTLQSTYPVSKAALPFMKELQSKTQETVHLNVIEDMDRVCVENIESPQNLRASMPIGSRSPLYAGASSKCLLAFSSDEFIESYLSFKKLTPVTENTISNVTRLRTEIAETRVQGFAISMGERTPGLGSLSAPILDHKGVLLASISLAIPEIRFNNSDHLNFCRQELIKATRSCSETRGYHHT
ncbi:MAG: IclR family transcriptional regulator [Desulfobacterales bacterium]|nr:IclR family transcriptional regulator [Desulfobacterales bacterium]